MKPKHYNLIGLLMIGFFLFFSCKKEEPTPEGGNKIEIGTTTISNISYRTATISTILTSTGGNKITQHGHCWSTDPEPEVNHDHTSLGSIETAKTFTSNLQNLDPNTTYFIRAYTTTLKVTVYGDEKELRTHKTGKPVVITAGVQNITLYTAQCGGEVVNDSGLVVTVRGVCWNKSGNPRIDDCIDFTSDNSGTGSFLSQITDLEEGTNYFVVAYATNEKGTGYGEVKSFQTVPITKPEVETANVINPTTNSAQCGGNVIDEGNGTVTARGVCWNTTGNPSIENCIGHTNEGGGSGSFVSNIDGLNEGTNYFVVAYATNEKGTGYGEVKSFETKDLTPCDGQNIIDYSGQVYNLVEIGYQCWFKENLNIGTRINGSQDQQNNGTIEKYCYNDNESYCDEYGGLYQWDEAMQYVTSQGAQGICPDGWHIPTDGEWDELVGYLGGSGVAGGKMKEAGYAHWNSPNTGATNSSGFTGLPGGRRGYSSGSFGHLGNYGRFWSSTESGGSTAWRRHLSCNNDDVHRNSYYKTYGFSVRCVQDGD